MRIDRVQLKNFKCYGNAELSLEYGVTVVHGVNGSGKSTLLEAIFFALYGSKALDGRTLEEVITTGETEAEVNLWFSHDGGSYRVHREVKRRDDRAVTTKCVLETGSETIEGARDVRREVTELLRMDSDAFVNCAYVRQGEVNKLIHASARDRQDMIDDLLQLGALEEYRERASDARLGVKTVLDGQREVLEDIENQIEAKAEKGLHDRLNSLETRRNELLEDIDRFEANRREAETTLENANSVLETYEETREELLTLQSEIEELREVISETETERERLKSEVRDRSSRREELYSERVELLDELDFDGDSDEVEDRIDDLETTDEELRDRLEDLRVTISERTEAKNGLERRASERREEASESRERAERFDERLAEDERVIEERETRLTELEEQIDHAKRQFEDAPVEFGGAVDHRAELGNERDEITSRLADVNAKIDAVDAAIENGEALLAEGKCPECGQPVDDSPHVDVIEERREEREGLVEDRVELEETLDALDERLERATELVDAEDRVDTLETNRQNVERLLEEKKEALSERREGRDDLLDRADRLEAEVLEIRTEIEEVERECEDARSKLGEINGRRAEVRSSLETLREFGELTDEIEELEGELERLRDRRANAAELNDERRVRLSEKRERKRKLEEEFDESKIETARDEKKKAEVYLEKVSVKLETLESSRDDLQNAIGAVENELEALEELRERRDGLETRCDRLESLYNEAETLQATYGDLRAELRRRNVETLERLLNETFDLVYQNDSYASIDLDGDYRLTVYQKDGEPLEPEQLSGGERALFNLSLRCAIYRLLAEGVEGTAPMPPLILDEPTVFLDAGHVTQLVSLIESMRDLGVEQIVVVSHDDELVGAADDLVRVEKDATSNRSRLERGISPVAGLQPAE